MGDNRAEQGEQKFKVRDLRRFDSAGNERGDCEPAKPSAGRGLDVSQSIGSSEPTTSSRTTNSRTLQNGPPETSAGSAKAGTSGQAKMDRSAQVANESSYDYADPTLTFSSFLISLATQALMQLGEIKAPDGVELPVDREAAKQTIDIISMLKQKTAGNLNPDELRLIEEILHNLRMSYVRVR